MNETLSNYFAEHRFDAESQARLLERSGCSNYDQFFNLLVALSGGTHCEELKSYLNGRDLNSNSIPIPSVKSSTYYAKSNSNVTSPRSSSNISVSAVVQSKPVTKQSCSHGSSVKAGSAISKEYLKVKPASLLSSPPKEREKTAVSGNEKSSLYHLSQLLPRSATEESYQQCLSPKAGKVVKQSSLPEASSNNLLRSLSSPVHVASPVSSYSRTKVESSPHVSTASVRDLYGLNHHRDAGGAYPPHQHLERTASRAFTTETHVLSNSSRTIQDVSSKLNFDQNTSLKTQKVVKEKNYHHRERKLSLETPKEIRRRTDSVSSVGSKSSGPLDFQQQLHTLQLQQQFDYLQQLQKRNQSPSKLSPSGCKTETTITAPNIAGTVASSTMSEHEHRQAFLSWAASQLPVPPLPSSSGLAVSAVSTSVAAASPTSLPLVTAKREPFNFADTKLLKKERHPSGPANSASSVTPGVLSPPAGTRNTSTFFSTATTTTAISSSSSSVTPQSLPSPLSHWPLPPTPCTPTMPIAPTLPPSHTPFWLPHHLSQSLPHHHPHHHHQQQQQQQHHQHHQFAAAATPPAGLGGGEGIGSGGTSSAAGAGVGYQVVTDPLSRHLILVHHAALQDVSSNLMWGYSGMAPLMSPQMLLTDPHFPRPLHPALLHASTLHPALHSSTPTLHPPTPTLQPPSSAFPAQVVPSSIGLQSGSFKTESPKASPKGLDDNAKGLLHSPASAGASSAFTNSLHSPMPPVMSAGLTTGLPGLPSSMTPGLPSPLSTAMPSVLSSVMPTALTPGLASSLPPTLPHYLYPPSSLPLFCPKPPMYPLSAFVQTPTTPVISVITTATTASTNTSPSSISVHNSGLLGLSSKESDISQSSLRASMSLPTPPTVVLSPQLPKSPSATKRERSASSPRRSRTSTPTLVLQPKSSPSSLLSSSTCRSSVPKIKLDNVRDSPSQQDANSTNSKSNIVRCISNSKIAIKKEIKEEYMSPIISTEKEHNCVDLSVNNHKIISNDVNNSGSIKQESGVPDSTKNSLNQSGVVLSPNVSPVNNDGSVHLPSLNSNPVVPDTTRINTAEVRVPVSSVGVTTATTSTTTTSVVFDSISCGREGTTTSPSSPAPTYRHLSVQTVLQPPFYRHSERNLSVGALTATPIVCSAPITPKAVTEICTTDYNINFKTSGTAAFAPVQEQALDLSGLELLSHSVVQHANRLSSEEPLDVSEEEFVRDQPTDLRANITSKQSPDESDIVTSQSILSTSTQNVPIYSSMSQFQPSDVPLNFSMNASSENQSVRLETRNDFIPTSPPPVLQPTGSRENFIFLCALAEEELFKDNNNEKDASEHVKTVTSSCSIQPVTDSRGAAFSKEMPFSGKQESFDATHVVDDAVSKGTVSENPMILNRGISSAISCSDEVRNETSNVPYCTDTSPLNDLSADSSPLDLSLGVSKKVTESEPVNCTSPKVSESELSLLLPSVGSNSPSSTRTSDGNHSCDSLITEKLLGTYDSSSSDSQNFEGFEDSSLRRTEENMRRQLVVLAKQYREKVRQVQRQFPKSDVCSSSHKSQRPSKRKRCPSESSRRSDSRHAKHHRGKDGRKRLASLQETVSCRRSSEENTERKSVPALSISKLKSKKLLSPRHDLHRTGHRSSSYEENVSSDDDNLPRRKWSLSFLSNDTKTLHSYKSHLLSPITSRVSDDEQGAEDDFSDSSETNSKALNTETSAVDSSDHETSFPPRSSSKKRKPGRPKKHSLTKKDATETIVTKKHKNLNLLLRQSSLTKSKVKPKLKAEAREITFDAHDSSDDHKDSPDENDCEADISFLKKVDSPLSTPAAIPDIHPTTNAGTKGLSSLTTPTPIASASSTISCNDLTKRRKPGGSSSLTRRAIMRDKAKRKTDAEQQYQMEALFRSLKKRSTLANAEHDESEEEDLDYDSDQSAATSISAHPPAQKEEESSLRAASADIVVKTETNTSEIELTDAVAADVGSVTIKTETVKDTLDTNVSSSIAEAGASVPLGLGLLSGSTRTPSVCHLAVDELVKGCRVLLLRDDGLLYAGSVNPITPPDLYGLIIDGERGSKGHIYCAEELLTQAWKEVKPGSTRFLKEGTRVCCFWSQQYRALYSGTVGSASASPAQSDASSLHNFVNVEFDDGDSGRIHVDDIRLLPQDYPVTVPKPNPLLTLCTRKRRAPQRDSTETRPMVPSSSSSCSSSSSTSVKLTVTTSASGMCRVTSSTTSTVNATQYGSEFTDESLRSKKSRKAKKKKKTSLKKQQKRLSREWEEENANGSDVQRNDMDKPKLKKIKLNESEVVCKANNLKCIAVETSETENFSSSQSVTANTDRLIDEHIVESNHTSELGKSSKKKKKKHHSKSEESSHKKRKHKHKKSKNRHDDGESLMYKCDKDCSQSTILTIHSSPLDSNCNQSKVFPHVEQVDGDLRVRIKSPPPNKPTKENIAVSQSKSMDDGVVRGSILTSLPPSVESALNTNAGTTTPVTIDQSSSKVPARNQRDFSTVTSQRIKECREKARKRVKDSRRPKRSSSRAESVTYDERSDDNPGDDEESSPDEDISEEELSDDGKTKVQNGKSKISGKKSRHHSGRSKIAAFLPEKDLWQWSGRGSKKTTGKGRGRKIFYKEIVRGDETIKVGDCCVFRSSGPPDNPYIGRIEHLCEGWGGSKSVTVHWFYHPNEIQDEPKKLKQPKGALFESNHRDTNDLQTISYKCQVLPLDEYRARHTLLLSKHNGKRENVNSSGQCSCPTSSDTTSGDCCTSCNASSGVLTDALDTSVEMLNSCANCAGKESAITDACNAQSQADPTSQGQETPLSSDLIKTYADSAHDEQNNLLCKPVLFEIARNDVHFSKPVSSIVDSADSIGTKILTKSEESVSSCPGDLVTETSVSTVNGSLTDIETHQTERPHSSHSETALTCDNPLTYESNSTLTVDALLSAQNDFANHNAEKSSPEGRVSHSDAVYNQSSSSDLYCDNVNLSVSDKILPTSSGCVPENHEVDNVTSASLAIHSSSSADSSSSEDSDDENDVLNECYYLAGTYDVIHQVLRMEPGVE